jgi:hypothetical protein
MMFSHTSFNDTKGIIFMNNNIFQYISILLWYYFLHVFWLTRTLCSHDNRDREASFQLHVSGNFLNTSRGTVVAIRSIYILPVKFFWRTLFFRVYSRILISAGTLSRCFGAKIRIGLGLQIWRKKGWRRYCAAFVILWQRTMIIITIIKCWCPWMLIIHEKKRNQVMTLFLIVVLVDSKTYWSRTRF